MTGRQSFPLARLAARALPHAADPAVARVVAVVAARLSPQRERAVRQNLAVLRPGWSPAELARAARGAQTAYARFLLDYLRHTGRPLELEKRVRFADGGVLERAAQRGRGLVLCTAHVGSWEVGAMALAHRGLPTMVVAGPQFARAWRREVRRAKAQAGIQVVGPGESPRRLLRHLAGGGAVCLLVDGDVYERGWPARVGTQTVVLPSGPARLATSAGADLAGALCLRAGDGFRIEMRALGPPAAERPRDPRLLHDAVAGWLAHTLERHASEWCLFRPFFRDARSVA